MSRKYRLTTSLLYPALAIVIFTSLCWYFSPEPEVSIQNEKPAASPSGETYPAQKADLLRELKTVLAVQPKVDSDTMDQKPGQFRFCGVVTENGLKSALILQNSQVTKLAVGALLPDGTMIRNISDESMETIVTTETTDGGGIRKFSLYQTN